MREDDRDAVVAAQQRRQRLEGTHGRSDGACGHDEGSLALEGVPSVGVVPYRNTERRATEHGFDLDLGLGRANEESQSAARGSR